MDDEGWGNRPDQDAGDGHGFDAEASDIQSLLDLGYEQLDGFVQWQEEHLGESARIAQQHCFNAEALLDYLANHQRKSAVEINEFELRWFLFSHYIRKAMADEETELRLTESLSRFYQFLGTAHSEMIPHWLPGVLEDEGYYRKRRQLFHQLNQSDETLWEEGYQDWCQDLEEDLDARCLWLPRDLGDGMQWGNVMGWREATLYAEANRNWQQKRELLLSDGLGYDGVRDRLTGDYYRWLDTPQEKLDDQAPREVIAVERLERSDNEDLPDADET